MSLATTPPPTPQDRSQTIQAAVSSERRISNGEIVRKILHMSPGLLPFGLALVPHPDPLDTVSQGVVVGVTAFLTLIFLLSHRIVRRAGEDNFLSTALSYPATILLVLLLFPANAEFATVVLSILAIGDGSACLGGKLFGKKRLPWNSEKTCVGSFCFVLFSAPVATLAYWIEATPNVAWTAALACGSAAAIAGAIAESLPTKITDNLRVGVAASLAVIATHFAIV